MPVLVDSAPPCAAATGDAPSAEQECAGIVEVVSVGGGAGATGGQALLAWLGIAVLLAVLAWWMLWEHRRLARAAIRPPRVSVRRRA